MREGANGQEIAEYLVLVWDAGDDCRSKLRAVDEWAKKLPITSPAEIVKDGKNGK